MRSYAPYIRYSKAMNAVFLNPAFSLETRYVPYQFYHFIELYRKFGGKDQTVEAILKENGLSEKELKAAYESYFGGGSGGASVSDAEYVATLVSYFPYILRLQSMSADEYARASDEERMVDSMLWQLVEGYRADGGDMTAIESDANWAGIDKARSRRLSEEYMSKQNR